MLRGEPNVLATLVAVAAVCILCLGMLAFASVHPPPNAAPSTHDLAYNEGPVMSHTDTYAIFWLPPHHHFEVQGSDTRYEHIITSFLTDLGGTSYYRILTQYSTSDGSDVAHGPIENRSHLAGVLVDRHPYPHAGTQPDPLQDTNLTAEVRRDIRRMHWTAGLDHLFLIFLGASVSVCDTEGMCTFYTGGSAKRDCGYHTDDELGGESLVMAVLPDSFSLSYTGTCIPLDPDHSPHHDVVADSEIVVLSHELFEAVTDPLLAPAGWYDGDPNGGEIGDKCTRLREVVRLHGHPYVVQDQWSNADGGCVVSYGGGGS